MQRRSVKLAYCLSGLCIATAHESESIAGQCQFWPRGWPKEHHDSSCNIEAKAFKERHTDSRYPASIKDYLDIPEEKTWVCPLEDDTDITVNRDALMIGQPTKWIVYNRASTPIIISLVDELPLDVGLHQQQIESAVYPNGPVVLPGDMAMVHGYQGQLYTAREYNEDYNSILSLNDEGVNLIKDILPPTWSFGTKRTRYVNPRDGVMHVFGTPGRILMKHRMGMIHVKNEYGAVCPEMFGASSKIDPNVNRTPLNNPNPGCNSLNKGFINKVGCPIDLYFSPPKSNPSSSFNCEVFADHIGAIDSFIKSGETDLDAFGTPVVHHGTFNTHSFVARMSHDQSLVARFEIDHDIVYDCPEPRRSAESIEVTGVAVQYMLSGVLSNSTEAPFYDDSVAECFVNNSKAIVSIDEPSLHKSMYSGVISGSGKHVTS